MSPRRMDISSLLRDPSPPADDRPPRHPDRPRTIDALLHPQQPDSHPASLLAILNSPSRDRPDTQPSPRTALPHHRPADHPPPRPFDALVHVASEERRRIAAVSDRDSESDFATHLDRDNPPIRASLVHDHDWPSRHHNSPYAAPHPHHHPDFASPSQDSSRPYKRARDTTPRSPSPDSRFSRLTSPSTRHHSSASPTNNYPTLRRQLIEPSPSRSAHPLLAASDTRAIPLQHDPPFLHSFHPSHPPSHSSPRSNSSLHHSPQYLRSQHHSSPILPPSLGPTPAELDAMSPRYSHGPRMAGGIQVLSNDLSAVRDSQRPSLSNYQSSGRDMPSERFVSDARHEQPRLSPLSARVFSPDSAAHQLKAHSYQTEAQESALPRKSRPPHSPLHPTINNGTNVFVPVMENDIPAQPLPERHLIRVWEEQPTARETSRRVSPVRMPSVVRDPEEGSSWPGACKCVEPPPKGGWRVGPLQDVAENAPPPPLFTSEKPPSPPAPISEPLVSDSRALIQGYPLDLQLSSPISLQSRAPTQSDSQTLPSQTLHLDSSLSCVPTSPILDFHSQNPEAQSEYQHGLSAATVDATTSAPSSSSDQNTTEPLLGEREQTPGVVDANDFLMANPHMSPQLVGTSNYSTHATVSQSTCRSPSQQPLLVPLTAKDEYIVPPEDMLVSPPIALEPPSHRSPELESTSEVEPPVSEGAVMDVDEELLSLVEDRPTRVYPASSKMNAGSRSPLPTTIGQDIVAGTGQGLSEMPDRPSSVLSSSPAFKPPFATDGENDRASIPPSVARNKKVEKDKTTLSASTTTGGRKKKDGTTKLATKPKQPPKPRAKPVPKAKPKPNTVDSSKGSILKGVVNVNSRSRSTSAIPGAADDIVPEPEVDNSEREDDKLYCVCKTRYDEDRMMIACDRCDEWFHTLCVSMPDLEIDLVDQFVCPLCIEKHPHLRTTWKRRCLFGLQHENPSLPEACHKPSRGVFSKYCSDDCGKKYMQVQIAHWEKLGGARDLLWESVKNAPKREGVVVCTRENKTSPSMMRVDSDDLAPSPLNSVARRRAGREVTRLNARLEEVVKERELMKRELDMVLWREKVVGLASERAGKVDECGWDQRLCFGKEEWADFGPEVLESYEETRAKEEPEDNVTTADVSSAVHGEWWCTGKKKCERHAGWQKLRIAEVSFDRETKEGILLKLTTREREIRKFIEDILYPQSIGTLQVPSKLPHPEVQLNGLEKLHFTSHVSERAKRRTS